MNYQAYIEKFRPSRIKKAIVAEITAANNSNSVIALSLALGAFIAFSPSWGFQTALALSLAVLLRLNKVLVLVTVNISSIPPIIPLILIAGYQTGAFVLTGQFQTEVPDLMDLKTLGENYLQFALGSLIVASGVGSVLYLVILLLLRRFR
ncbi:DUF2062 domain-containing protein [Marinifilum flexuosum]|uniref:DUF2062 domain-containing protein n=1 Tax=Marinifilum flexuosum TaxID=1117708 RepID=UPI0024946C5C|nr:DUF2062 domain-containing protein [Marinifilum flexuosum]